MKNFNKFIFLVLSILLVAGCETLPEQSKTTVEWQSHQARLTAIEQFEASGKIGFRSPKDRLSVSFNWKHTAELSKLRLINVLGKTMLTLTIDDQGAKIVTSDNQVYQDSSANRLFYQLTHIMFPVEQMQDWIKGLPTQADSYALDENHTLSSLRKTIDGKKWRMSYSRYQDIGSTPLPNKMTLRDADNVLNIVISNWKLGQ